jgi:hypothetical protein
LIVVSLAPVSYCPALAGPVPIASTTDSAIGINAIEIGRIISPSPRICKRDYHGLTAGANFSRHTEAIRYGHCLVGREAC